MEEIFTRENSPYASHDELVGAINRVRSIFYLIYHISSHLTQYRFSRFDAALHSVFTNITHETS